MNLRKLTMKTTRRAFLSAFVVIAVVSVSQLAAAQMVIDNFSTGAYAKTLTKGIDNNTQTGSMAGASRYTVLSVCEPDNCADYNPFRQPNSFQVRPATKSTPSALIFNTGYKSDANLQVIYGGGSPMNLNLSPTYDRIRLYFDGADQGINFALTVYTGGPYSSIGCNFVDPAGDLKPFTVDLPFANFGGSADFSDITEMDFEFDLSQGLYTGEDWALTSIQAVLGGQADITCGSGS